MKYYGEAKDKFGNVGYSTTEDTKKKINQWINRMKTAHGVAHIAVFENNKKGLLVYENKMIWKPVTTKVLPKREDA